MVSDVSNLGMAGPHLREGTVAGICGICVKEHEGTRFVPFSIDTWQSIEIK